MIVSWNWLKDYVQLDMPPSELARRLALSGLNHESTREVADDLAIDLEVTSNRPDCLGHIGIAREISVLWDRELVIPPAVPIESARLAEDVCTVSIACPQLCRRYTARVIRGVRIRPSPDWLAQRLRTLGIAVINNIVDITNYVMMECNQPLHAFDLAKINGGRIVVRDARPGENFLAIDHRTYQLQAGMCVISGGLSPLALGGVMGGADSEVSAGTTDLLIEAADFAPLSIRNTAWQLRLHSPSSYRFERGIDPAGIDWASRRACQLILELAGGELLAGVADATARTPPSPPPPIVLRFARIKRILGIELEVAEVLRILEKLGLQVQRRGPREAEFSTPSWRRDLSREVDLIEEVARIHGYHQIPEDVGVRMVASHRSDRDRLLAQVRKVLVAAGFFEAMTPSAVGEELSSVFSPWTDAAPIRCSTPMLRGADCLRRSLIPSLLAARRINESFANPRIELFETAHVYLPRANQLPQEELLLAITTGGDFRQLKGVLEAILAAVGSQVELELDTRNSAGDLLHPQESCSLILDGKLLGYLGTVSATGLERLQLRAPTCVAELRMGLLQEIAQLIPQYRVLSPFPAITYDLNLVVPETARWSDLLSTVRTAAGPTLEEVRYRDTYRDPRKDGPGRHRLFFSIVLRSSDSTMTNQDADGIRDQIVAACESRHGALLLS